MQKHFEQLLADQKERQEQGEESKEVEAKGQSYHLLWLIVHHINEEPVKKLCRQLCKDKNIAHYLLG